MGHRPSRRHRGGRGGRPWLAAIIRLYRSRAKADAREAVDCRARGREGQLCRLPCHPARGVSLLVGGDLGQNLPNLHLGPLAD